MDTGVRTIGAHAFQNCKALANIEFSQTLDSIEKAAFLGCESLGSLRLPANITTIGDHALRGMVQNESIVLPSSVIFAGQHALYANLNLTVYAEGDSGRSEYWTLWNSSWRPVIYGCTLSSDKSYVVSLVKDKGSVTNADAIGGISAPERSGYVFLGWATTEGGSVVYSAADISSVKDGTTLYAIWQEQLAE